MTLCKELKIYLERYPEEARGIAPLLEQLALSDSSATFDHFDRKTLPGHITASAIVIEENKILMIFHPFLKRWLQPGGHVDAGEIPLEAAARELLEETGLSATLHPWHQKNSNVPFDIDVHPIPANPSKGEAAHWHYDFRYLMMLDKNSLASNHQDHDFDWIPLEKVEEPSLLKIIEKARQQILKSKE